MSLNTSEWTYLDVFFKEFFIKTPPQTFQIFFFFLKATITGCELAHIWEDFHTWSIFLIITEFKALSKHFQIAIFFCVRPVLFNPRNPLQVRISFLQQCPTFSYILSLNMCLSSQCPVSDVTFQMSNTTVRNLNTSVQRSRPITLIVPTLFTPLLPRLHFSLIVVVLMPQSG